MPDETYTWVVMKDGVSFPIGVFQKKYNLRSWIELEAYTGDLTILRFPPYADPGEWVEIDVNTLKAKK